MRLVKTKGNPACKQCGGFGWYQAVSGPVTCSCASYTLYECGICDCYHPWSWDGDCRDDANRFGSPEEYAQKMGVSIYKVEVRSMDDRVATDCEENRRRK